MKKLIFIAFLICGCSGRAIALVEFGEAVKGDTKISKVQQNEEKPVSAPQP